MSNLTIEVKNDAMLGRLDESYLHIELIKKDKEIERLNNIINELEEWLIEETNLSDDRFAGEYHCDLSYVIDKLKELKENR